MVRARSDPAVVRCIRSQPASEAVTLPASKLPAVSRSSALGIPVFQEQPMQMAMAVEAAAADDKWTCRAARWVQARAGEDRSWL
jgi:hypothetical protein